MALAWCCSRQSQRVQRAFGAKAQTACLPSRKERKRKCIPTGWEGGVIGIGIGIGMRGVLLVPRKDIQSFHSWELRDAKKKVVWLVWLVSLPSSKIEEEALRKTSGPSGGELSRK